MTGSERYEKGQWVVVRHVHHRTNVERFSVQKYPVRIGTVVGAATAGQIAAKEAEIAEMNASTAKRMEREAQQDWQDASLIAGCLDNDRERSIELLGAELLAEIAAKLRKG